MPNITTNHAITYTYLGQIWVYIEDLTIPISTLVGNNLGVVQISQVEVLFWEMNISQV